MTSPVTSFDRDIGKLEGSLSVLTKLSFSVIALLGLLIAGGATILVQMAGLRSDLSNTQKDIASTNQKLAALENGFKHFGQVQSSSASLLARIESRLVSTDQQKMLPQQPGIATVVLEAHAATFIFDYLRKLNGVKPTLRSGFYTIGSVVPETALREFPQEILAKLPQLKMTRYAVTEKLSILLVSTLTKKVVGILGA